VLDVGVEIKWRLAMPRFKPMRGATWEKGFPIPHPVLATPKIDGIRFLMMNGKAVTRKLKPIPNRALRAYLEQHLPDGLEGELKAPGKFNMTSSAVMSHENEAWRTVKILIFDIIQMESPYIDRMRDLNKIKGLPIIKLLPVLIRNDKELHAYEKKMLKAGHEGVMLRVPGGFYKFGKSTLNQFWLVKYIRTLSAEAKVVGFNQFEHNDNEATTDELGKTKRSKKKEGMVLMPMTGSFIVKGINGTHKGKVFNVGGITRKLAEDSWNKKSKYLGQVMTFEYKPYGEKDLPRHARFKAWRKGY
jgi:DNA ligase-1